MRRPARTSCPCISLSAPAATVRRWGHGRTQVLRAQWLQACQSIAQCLWQHQAALLSKPVRAMPVWRLCVVLKLDEHAWQMGMSAHSHVVSPLDFGCCCCWASRCAPYFNRTSCSRESTQRGGGRLEPCSRSHGRPDLAEQRKERERGDGQQERDRVALHGQHC